MYDRSRDRRKLGLKCREVVLRSFHGNRYLREHEQMYWVQWHLARMRADERLTAEMDANVRFGIPAEIRCEVDDDDDDEEDDASGEYGNQKKFVKRYRWQDFEKKKFAKKKDKKTIVDNARAKKGNSLEALRTGGQKKVSKVSVLTPQRSHQTRDVEHAWDLWDA